MRLMGLEAICPKLCLSNPAEGQKEYPYLLKGADITYIRLSFRALSIWWP